MKNAHIIGSLRRILKLLYNKIKPVFVFDGATPALKLETVRNRRKIRERQEINLKKQAERILMARLKQHAIESHKKKTAAVGESKKERKKGNRNSRYADGFQPLASARLCIEDKEDEEKEQEENEEEEEGFNSIQTSAKIVPVYRPDTLLEQEREQEGEGVLEDLWEDGYTKLKNKPFKSLSDDEHSENANDSDSDNYLSYDVPELFSDHLTSTEGKEGVGVDIGVLAALPPHMRKAMIEQAR